MHRYLRSRKLCFITLMTECPYQFLYIVLHVILVYSPLFVYLITFLYQCGITHIHFICRIIIQHYVLSSQPIPSLAIGVPFYLTAHHYCVYF